MGQRDAQRKGAQMSEMFSFILSPHGAALCLVFWVFKTFADFWLANRAILLMPVLRQSRPQRWLNAVKPNLTRRDTSERHDT